MIDFDIGTKFNDVITEDVIESWGTDNVILNGATGSGKTYLIENNLHTYAEDNFKSILFLCNRTALYQQVLLEVKEEGLHNIEVMLYQTLQSKLKEKQNISRYNFIACDEWHYVLSDAMFNKYTDLTYDWIIDQKDSCKIFMSGTAENIFNKLKVDEIVKEEHEYIIPYSYDYVKECKFFKEKCDVFDIINHILTTTDDKVIYFVNSTDFAIEVYKQFKDNCIFRCSTHSKNTQAKELNDVDCIKGHSRDLITFDKRILITTKALDNGIDIRDKNVKHIICDVFDLESAQQCLGRKRKIDDNDTCTFYIRNYSKKAIGSFKGGLNKNYNPVELFVEQRKEFEEKYGQDRDFHTPYIYNEGDKRKYNKLAYWKMICDSSDIATMELITYKELFLQRLGDTMTNVIDLEELEKMKLKSELELYLEDIKCEKLFKDSKDDQQKKLIDMIDIRDKRNRQQSSPKQLNAYLQVNFQMSLMKDRDRNRNLEDGSINPNRDKTYWMVIDGIVE
ncbi:hypothetical protein psyc5s11_36680 [Clostridium gelidum]|uniref:Helicase ATP-binding domain-containing protein n=1 Tax=Clostridium gelidum TaxID=704125 RepID=A0ABN6IZQ1_9CLOT|nr:DEAD/DEAH box helicase family protein [Clostridium gelidum]BCZ47601.1 hypothetical protein psyc5s11_36680 [Clostridium gelidum]